MVTRKAKKKKKNTGVKEKEKAISEALKPKARTAQVITQEVDKILRWIDQEEKKLAINPEHQAFLSLDFEYTDEVRRTVVDTILRLLGSRLLNEKERLDFKRPASIGIQSTTRPNLYTYYEHKRDSKEALIQEKYILFVSRDMKLPVVLTPEKIEEVRVEEKEVAASPVEPTKKLPPPETLEEREEKKVPGIFETINKVLLGEEEE